MNTSPTVRLVGLALLVTLSAGGIWTLEPQGGLAQSRPKACDVEKLGEQIAIDLSVARGRVDALERAVEELLISTEYSEQQRKEEIRNLQREANGVNQQINQARAVNNRLKACTDGSLVVEFEKEIDTLTQRLDVIQEGIKQARINLKT